MHWSQICNTHHLEYVVTFEVFQETLKKFKCIIDFFFIKLFILECFFVNLYLLPKVFFLPAVVKFAAVYFYAFINNLTTQKP